MLVNLKLHYNHNAQQNISRAGIGSYWRLLNAELAEGVGFEPTVDLRLRQFSRLLP